MLKNQNIICISSIDWDFVWQGHQEVMTAFAKSGNRVLFIENTGVRVPNLKDMPRIKRRIENWLKGIKGIRKGADNIYIYSPIVLPFPYSRIIRWINKHLILSVIARWTKAMDFTDPIIWTFLPTGLALDLITGIDKKLVVYYCIADFEKLVKHPNRVRKAEAKVIQKSDVIFAQGEELKKRCQKYNSNVTIFPFGVNTDTFSRDSLYKDKPADMVDIETNGAVLGYIGGVHRHIDFQLIKFLAQRNTNWKFVFIGPIQTDISLVKNLPNVIFLGKKEHKDLPAYMNNFSICLIPYILNDYTQTVYPTKLNEYFAMGKAIVSTDLPEIASFNKKHDGIIYIAKNKEEFENLAKQAINENNPFLKDKRVKIAQENNWSNRVEQMSAIMEKEIESKKKGINAGWKENLASLYWVARKRVLKIAMVSVFACLLFFHTSLLWFLAGPLRVQDTPRASDAIIVFAGGVGESGKAGQGYEERVEYAVELYKKGFAKKIIFSSGYKYAIKEAQIMKALAVSLGISGDSILLEEKAKNTYENVKYTAKMLDDYNWNSALLVTSPYHTKRSSMVFFKVSPGKNIIYTPIPNSLFYSHKNNASLSQIAAIFHEYLGIVYYKFKGYI